MTIGLTGGIGSGKSTIAQELAKRGFAVYDCDREAKRIIVSNLDVRNAIIALLGEEAFIHTPSTIHRTPYTVHHTPTYNTRYVAQQVFAKPHLLQRLNAIVHPAVKKDIFQQSGLSVKPVFFIESAILFESGFDRLCDKVVIIEAPEEVRIARTIARDYNGEATEENINKVRARMRAQESTLNRPQAQTPSSPKILRLTNDGLTPVSLLADQILSACVSLV